jgi:hypothetical protein
MNVKGACVHTENVVLDWEVYVQGPSADPEQLMTE